MKKLWIYIVGCAIGIIIIVWVLVLIFVNNAIEPDEQNPTLTENINSLEDNNGDKTVNSDNNIMEQNTVDNNDINNKYTTDNHSTTMSYYLHFENDKVVIYREPNREFYDYADIELDVLPPEIKEQIKLGMYIDGEEQLYDFLQTYSS